MINTTSPGQVSETEVKLAGGPAAAQVSPGTAAPGPAVAARFRETRRGWLVLGVVWLVSAIYVGACLGRGWVPHDAGTLGQMAERTLRGQVPFRDFAEVYGGGLTYLNALAFRLWGINCFSLRIPLFLFFLGWVPAVYFIARRFVAPLAAGVVTLLAVAWSVPNYPEAMPSWYNLFFATWGTLALLRYTETEKRRWLWVAGLCGGLSFLSLLTGLYFVAAALLFLVYHEQSRSSAGADRQGGANRLYSVFVTTGLLAFLATVAAVVTHGPLLAEAFNFELPAACLVALLLRREWTEATGDGRFRRLFWLGLPFLGGVLAPIAVFLAFYARQGALRDWFEGVLASPMAHVRFAALSAPSPLTVIGIAPLAGVLLLAYFKKELLGRFTGPAVIAGLAGLLMAAHRSPGAYGVLGLSLPALVPLAALALVLLLGRSGAIPEQGKQKVFLVVSAAAACALIQFPFSNPTYFCYVAPLVLLACVALVSMAGQFERISMGALVVFYLAFAVWLHTPGYFAVLGASPGEAITFRALNLPRGGGIRVKAEQAAEYEELVGLVRAHARGAYIYAGPDSPEVYFLTGSQNPTRTLFAFRGSDFGRPAERTQRILGAIDRNAINAVVLREDSEFSGPPPAQLRAALAARYPESAKVGGFEVRWRP